MIQNELREAVTSPLIAAGIELFGKSDSPMFKNGVPKDNILGWLFDYCMATDTKVNMVERAFIVAEIQDKVNHVVGGFNQSYVLTVVRLRQLIAALPENMPVFYQRIEDAYFSRPQSGWKTHPFKWDSPHELSEAEKKFYAVPDKADSALIYEENGKDMVQYLTGGIAAFGAYVGVDPDGKKALFIHAHY